MGHMLHEADHEISNAEYDIVVCGAGLAGLTLARHITMMIPQASMLLVGDSEDKSKLAGLKVGESTIELSAHYLTEILGLKQYFEDAHHHKMGFRFFFGHGDDAFHKRPEFGTSQLSPLNSYQIERGRLEHELANLNQEMGVHMWPGSWVQDIAISADGGLHIVYGTQRSTGQQFEVRCRWLVDGMGRRRFIQKKLGIAAQADPHFSAAWFRIQGRIDVEDLVPETEWEWHERVPGRKRYFSTNHLMDNGRWVWLIPLAPDRTSIGVVTHEDFFPFTQYNSYEKMLDWLEKHETALWRLLGDRQPLDFQCMRHYSYGAKQVFSINRWACTGDAGVFSDPFFSPGIDQIGFTNTIIVDLITRDLAGKLTEETVDLMNNTYLNYNSGISWLTHNSYPYFGTVPVIAAKLLWDIVRGFTLNGPQRYNRIYLDEEKSAAVQPMLARIFQLTLRMEKFFKQWADRSPRCHSFAFLNYLETPRLRELYLRNLRENKTTEELVTDHQVTLEYLEELTQVLFLVALADVMPEALAQLPSPRWLNAWGVGLDPDRWAADKLFAPSTPPRPLPIAEFAQIFGVAEVLVPAGVL